MLILTKIRTEKKKILTKIKTERKKIKMEKKKTQMEMKKMQMEKKKMERKMIQVVKEIKRKVGKIPMTSKQEVEVPRLFQLKNQLLHLLHLPLRLLNLKSPRILLKKKIGETTFKFNKRCMKNNVKIQSKILWCLKMKKFRLVPIPWCMSEFFQWENLQNWPINLLLCLDPITTKKYLKLLIVLPEKKMK